MKIEIIKNKNKNSHFSVYQEFLSVLSSI